MLRFLDGPLAGKATSFTGAPIFLRARTISSPSGEPFVAYRIVSAPDREFIDGIDATTNDPEKRFGQVDVSADYRVVPNQPDQLTMSDPARWASWCAAQYQKEPKP